MNFVYYTIFYKINRYNNDKIYTSRVRASALERALEVLKECVGNDIEVTGYEVKTHC